jgi:hypothetical protein
MPALQASADSGPNLNDTHALYVRLKAGARFTGYAMAALRLRLPERQQDAQDGSFYRYFEIIRLNIVLDSALLTDMAVRPDINQELHIS